MGALVRYNSPAKVQRIGNDSVYGTGSDGTVVIAANTSLTRDMYYSNLTINSGSHLNTNGYKVFVKNTLTVNGSIGVSAGVSVSNATLTGTPAIGTSVTNSIGGNAAGVTYTASQVSSDVRSYIENILMGASVSGSGTVSAFTGGAGGGNGAAGTVTPATAGTGATNGAAGSAGTGATNGADGVDGTGATNGAAGTAGTGATAGGAGGAGELGPHRNVLAPGGNGTAGTPGTNGAAGAAGSNGTNGAKGLAGTPGTNGAGGAAGSNGTNGAAGSTPPAALAGAGARGGGVVLVCAKLITGTGTIMSLGSNAGLGGNAATGTGATNGTAGTGATPGTAGVAGSGRTLGTAGVAGSGATAGGVGSDGVAGTAAPGQAVAHHVNSHAHIINGDGTHGTHVQVPSPALPRGHVAAAHGQHAHGSYTNTHHGATPVHPANHHGGSSPTYGSASTTHAHVAPSGYFHQNSIPHNAGGHLGHDGAVAHGESGNVEFGVVSYHEHDAHHAETDHKHGAHGVVHASRPRTDHVGHHYNGEHRRAGDQRHAGHVHKAGGAAGAKGLKGTDGTTGTNGAAGTSGTPGTNGAAGSAGSNGTNGAAGTAGTNGSTTAGTNGQSGGGGGIFIITDSTPTGVTTSVSGGILGGVSASSGNVITVLNA